MAVDGYVFRGRFGCSNLCASEGVLAQPAQLVASGGEIPACAEEDGEEGVGGVGAEEERLWEAGHVLWGGLRWTEIGRGLAVGADITSPQAEGSITDYLQNHS